jgi:hypothetical protein
MMEWGKFKMYFKHKCKYHNVSPGQLIYANKKKFNVLICCTALNQTTIKFISKTMV